MEFAYRQLIENVIMASKQSFLPHSNPKPYFLLQDQSYYTHSSAPCVCVLKTNMSPRALKSCRLNFVITDLQQSGSQCGTEQMEYYECVGSALVKTLLGVPGQEQQQMREAEHQSSRENPLYILLLLQADPYEMESSFLSPPLYLTPSSLTNPFLSSGQSLLPKAPSYCLTVEFTSTSVFYFFPLSEVPGASSTVALIFIKQRRCAE